MSVALSFNVRDYATPSIEAKLAKCSPRRLGAILGRPLMELWRNRLRSLGTNKRGWPSTHFYEDAARNVTNLPQENGVVIRADKQGLRQRWLGGHIAPVKAKALTIPIAPEAYGKTANQFPGLFMVKTRKGVYLCIHTEGISEKGREVQRAKIWNKRDVKSKRKLAATGLLFLFKLVQGVDQVGDPRVVPTNEEFAEVALATIAEAIK